jgi:hypothetical protein
MAVALCYNCSAWSEDNALHLKEVTSDESFFRVVDMAVVFSSDQRGDGWWSIFVSGVSIEEGSNIFSDSKR